MGKAGRGRDGKRGRGGNRSATSRPRRGDESLETIVDEGQRGTSADEGRATRSGARFGREASPEIEEVAGGEMEIQRSSPDVIKSIEMLRNRQGGTQQISRSITATGGNMSVTIPSGQAVSMETETSTGTVLVSNTPSSENSSEVGEDFRLRQLKARRDVCKRSVYCTIADLKKLMDVAELDKSAIMAKLARLEDAHMQLKAMDDRVFDALLGRDAPALYLDQEHRSSLDTGESVMKIKGDLRELGVVGSVIGIEKLGTERGEKRTPEELPIKLPKMEVFKYDGQSADWLSWWGQFRVIHENQRVPALTKFRYLLQSVASGSKAEMVVKSMDLTAENYPLVVQRLKDRFGDEDEIRDGLVNEIIDLVHSAVLEKLPFITLYDKLECKLSSLGTLGESTRQQCQLLVARIEVALPMEMARNWELRKEQARSEANGRPVNLLDLLMAFLRKEVKLQEKMTRARSLIDSPANSASFNAKVPTVANLAAATTTGNNNNQGQKRNGPQQGDGQGNPKRKPQACAFCDGQHHSNACLNVINWNRKQKMDHLKKSGACFRCLKKGHQARECKSNVRCCNCKGSHYPIVCGGRSGAAQDQPKTHENGEEKAWKPRPWKKTVVNDKAEEDQPLTRTINNYLSQLSGTNVEPTQRHEKANAKRFKSNLLNNLVSNSQRTTHLLKETPLQTVKLWVKGPGGEKLCRALLDSGASKSAILLSTAQELHLDKVHSERIGHNLYGGSETQEVDHGFYRICLRSVCGRYQITMPVMDERQIVRRVSTGASKRLLESLKEAGVELTDCNDDSEVELLLGNDVYGKLVTGKVQKIPYKSSRNNDSSQVNEIVVEGLDAGSEITALETLFGWVLSGYSEVPEIGGSHHMSTLLSAPEISQLWDLEVLGIRDPIETKSKQEVEEDITAYFQETAQQGDDGRFSIKLPFMMDRSNLPNNFSQAYRRLESTWKKLEEIKYLGQYNEVFESWLNEGVIEEVPLTEMKTGPFSYLPHRPVIKTDSSTTKIRPVFDASCKLTGSYSLNDILAKGPNLLEKIPEILSRFRLGQVAAISDIRKAFLQIAVEEGDRDVLRFLWKDKFGNLKVYRHRRVVFGVNCSPFLLAAVLEKHLRSYSQEGSCVPTAHGGSDAGQTKSADQSSTLNPGSEAKVASKLLNSFYVDNSVASFDSEEEYLEFQEKAVRLLGRAQFDLRMWESNLEYGEQEVTKVLGLTWNKKKDTLKPVVEKVQIPVKLTKRTLLAAAHSLFDPIGIYAPVTLIPKLLLRDGTVKGLGWDEELPEDIRRKFNRWCEEVPALDQVELRRPLAEVNVSEGKWSLHIFCDASQEAYAAVAFIRVETNAGVTVRFVQARNRLAPTKATIPRLELLAGLIGVRLGRSIIDAVGLNWTVCLWSDSSTALSWIRRPIVWGVFVENRVKEIRKTFEVGCWRFVPGTMNPADIPSRGMNPQKFAESEWISGPEWLKEPEETWPSERGAVDERAVLSEKRKSTFMSSAVLDLGPKWYCRTSGYRRNIRVVAYLLRWLRKKAGEGSWTSEVLQPEEVNFAERVIWAAIQKESGLEQKYDGTIQKRKGTPGKKVGLGQKLVKRQGLWCVNTRLTMKKDLEGFLWPVYLPNENVMVKLLIEAVHLENHHAGASLLLSKLREQVWIQNGRQTVKKVLSRCVRCRRDKGRKLDANTAPLPKDRMEASRVFEVTGVDYGGPLYLSNGDKVWFALFTCAVFRAIHLELVPSLSTEAFIQVFRRFRNRRGHVAKVYSDNGTNFRGYKNLMDKINWDEVKRTSGLDKVKWQFNPPAAPWWGGFWERLVQMVKQILRRTYGSASLDREEMETALTDAEAVLNSRPLTAITDDAGDLQPLTPNSFLLDAASIESLDICLVEKLGYPDLYRKREALRLELKERFRAEYLGSLAALGQQKKSKELKVGEIVLVECDNQKRVLWPLGRVMELIPGRDGVCRLARLKTAKGELLRAVQRLVPLGIEEEVPARLCELPTMETLDEGEAVEEEVVPPTHAEVIKEPAVTTRSGRVSRRPDRLNYTLASSDSAQVNEWALV